MPEAAESPTAELKILVTGSDKQVMIKDRDGKDHSLLSLTFYDLVEFEVCTGQSLLNRTIDSFNVGHVGILLYLSLRKEGCSYDDIAARKFKYTYDQVLCLFDATILLKQGILVKLLELAGFEVTKPAPTEKDGPTNPTSESPQS